MDNDTIVKDNRLLSESAAKTVHMMIWGGLLLSPMVHSWHNLMERVCVGRGKIVTKKVLADIVFMAPQMPIWYLTSTGLMAGKPLRQAFDESIEKQPVMLMANYMVWPTVNFISFSFVLLHYRLLVGNVVNLGWSSFLSYMANHPAPTLPYLKQKPAVVRTGLVVD
ncbi:hypothetical protein PI124_g3151 [Phytophthora idaei]|nr:hypothetical protein PI125_g1933 [Phytophthora idaei]KAG3171726.1 hypothetical protein PI126_g1742 [Phytophthora idaei]KAG3252214.1 hypothetical protein PI124_g3151 [Phytophthora idaei]